MDTIIEFDPYMKTGFKLVRRSKDPNSLKQMFKHLEDTFQEQYGGNRHPTNVAKKLALPTALLSKDLGIEQIDQLIGDDESSSSSSSSGPAVTPTKSIVEVCSLPPPTITLEQAKSDPVINIDSDSDMETDSNIETYICCVCKEGCVDVGYSLVECLECHSMYHQNCHTPPITDINLNDPRIVWYCSSCRQKDTQKTESRSSGKDSKKSSSKSASGSKSDKSSSSKSLQGGAKSSPSKSKSSSANSSPKHPYPATSNSAMSAAEKRVQMMKRKATKKTDKKK